MKTLIAFFEIPAADFGRAVDFYETVLDVKLQVSECETEKMACFMENGRAAGAVSWAPGFLPSPNGVLISFYCDRMEAALEKVVSKGGNVLIPATKIQAEGKGYFAVFADCEGNSIGLYAGE